MSKRSPSPVPLPPPKRHHISDNIFSTRAPRTFDSLLYDEVILLVFSYLSYSDLCAAQSVNRNWSRLALDNQLWKDLYIKSYGKQRLRGGKGLMKRLDGREVKPLPDRALSMAKEDIPRDWKWMFKISSNWHTGRCRLSTFDQRAGASASSSNDRDTEDRVHIVLASSGTIYASSKPSHAPAITVIPSYSSETHTIYVDPKSTSSLPVQITALAVDQSLLSTNTARFAVCLSSGELATYELCSSRVQTPTRLNHYAGHRFSRRTHPIVQVAYHHPLLFTLSESFSLSVYDATNSALQLVHHLSSFTSFPPASLVLTAPDLNTYKLLITYASPVYPQHWSLGMTEILMSCPARSTSPTRSTFQLLSSRTVRAFDVPPGWVDEARMRTVREQWSRKALAVAATNSDGKWVVLAPTETPCLACTPSNGPGFSPSAGSHPVWRHWTPASLPLQLYRVSFPPLSAGASVSPKLTFVRYLYGQPSPVASLALADGRCVSLGLDGSVWSWDLETAAGVQIYAVPFSPRDEPFGGEDGGDGEGQDEGSWCEKLKGGLRGTIAFDERKIISSGPGGVLVRDFDA